jgi:CubicO group peptidase (beta-lactamase class C family)
MGGVARRTAALCYPGPVAAGFDLLRTTCRAAVTGGATPGLVAVVGMGGRNLLHEAFGSRQIDPLPLPATEDTVYDLASLTKALVTSLLAMQAVGGGRLRLEDPLPGRAGEAGATVRLALAHASGLPAHRKFYERTRGSAGAVVKLAADEPVEYPPGSRSVYSDLDFILLGDLLARIEGAPLDVLAAERLFRPLGIEALGYLGGPTPSVTAFGDHPVAPTERCPWRGRLLVGEVDDGNAHIMGGVAGHAGLFGTAGAIATLAHALCAAWRDAASPLVDRAVLRAFWMPAAVPQSTWRLGWDGPAPHQSVAGALISRTAVGHLGFTGCSLWIDPERETFVLILSNRIHPTVQDGRAFRALRPTLNDAALAGAGYPGTSGG